MKTRIRWYSVAMTPARLRALADGFGTEAYTDERAHGFVLSEVRTRTITGRHVEKRITESRTVDPLGATFTQTIVDYHEVRFAISTEGPGLELINAPRAPKLFLSRLGYHLQYRVPIQQVTLDPLAWLTEIEQSGLSAQVGQVDYTQLAVAKGVMGALRAVGDADVREAAAKLIGRRAHQVRRVATTLCGKATAGASIACALDRVGTVTLPEAVAGDLLPIVRAALVSVASG